MNSDMDSERINKILDALKLAVTPYSKTRPDESKYVGNPIVLPNDSCPRGTVTCNPLEGECPVDGLRPNIFTKSGNRCSPPTLIKDHRDIDPHALTRKLRDLVVETNRLVRIADTLDKMKGLNSTNLEETKVRTRSPAVEAAESKLADLLAVREYKMSQDISSVEKADIDKQITRARNELKAVQPDAIRKQQELDDELATERAII